MIKNINYNEINGKYAEVLTYLNNKTTKPTVIDVGASYNPWGGNFITATVDLNETMDAKAIQFRGDINNIIVWDEVLGYVKNNGKFDFCICTHTLEDISNPILVSGMLSCIAKEGFVAVPSKYAESKRTGTPYRGWLHHRWIFNNEGEKIVAYPKLPFTEYLQCLDEISLQYNSSVAELSFYWEDTCDIQIINNDFFPSDNFALNIYNNLL